jgi:hypothetical protein
MAIAETASIACTLTPGDFRDRLEWIARLNRDALRRCERRDLSLVLGYAPEAAPRVREMVRREQECCAFLTFDLREESNEVALTISAPEDAREAADVLFEQFVGAPQGAEVCGCAAKQYPNVSPRDNGKTAGGVALVSASCAVAACSACILPFALPAALLAGAGGAFASFYNASFWMTGLAVMAVGTAWVWIWRQSVRSRLRPARSTLTMMGVASGLVASALFWPRLEPEILRLLIGG